MFPALVYLDEYPKASVGYIEVREAIFAEIPPAS